MMSLPAILSTVNAGPGPVMLATLVRNTGARSLIPGTRLLDPRFPGEDLLAAGRCQRVRKVLGPAWGLAPEGTGVGDCLLERLVPHKLPPWLNFCSMALEKGQTCVLATVCAVTGDVSFALGDHFAFDERNHGLLPMDRAFSQVLQAACERVRERHRPCLQSLEVAGGILEVLLEPLSTAAPVPAVILAAGASRRLGSPKQLVELEGESLLRRITRTALTRGGDVTVVTGFKAAEMAATLEGLPVQIVVNPQWEEGMASSIRAGVASLPEAASGVLLLVCDQLGVDPLLLSKLQAAHQEHPLAPIACEYRGVRGIPALLPAASFPRLKELRGDTGARTLLRGEEVIQIPFPGGEVDVDRPEDLPLNPS